MTEDQAKNGETERLNGDDRSKAAMKKTSRLHGLVVKPAAEGYVTVLCSAVALSARLPLNPPHPIRPGHWVNFEMDLSTGENQIVAECEPRYKTYLFDDGSFSVISPATYYLEDHMADSDYSVAYTPYFRFVDDPKGLLQKIDWMEWYDVMLAPAENCAYLLKVERLVRSIAGCIEPGALPGQMPSNEQIAAAINADARIKNYEGVAVINSNLLGLCIGHATYERVESSKTGKWSGYASGKGHTRGNMRGRDSNYVYNQRGGGGGWRGNGGGGRGYEDDWRRGRDGGGSRADGDWRVGMRVEKDNAPSMQNQRMEASNVKQVISSLIFTSRGIVMSKLEEERYEEGEWLVFEKFGRTDMAVLRQLQGRDTYPPFLLSHRLMTPGYGGETRVKDKGQWHVQIKVLVEFGKLRQKGWVDPSFFGKIDCNEMMLRKVRARLEKEKRGWSTMSEKEQDAVQLNMWIGMATPEMMQLPAMSAIPNTVNWQVKAMHEEEFLHDLPLDKAREAGALAAIVL